MKFVSLFLLLYSVQSKSDAFFDIKWNRIKGSYVMKLTLSEDFSNVKDIEFKFKMKNYKGENNKQFTIIENTLDKGITLDVAKSLYFVELDNIKTSVKKDHFHGLDLFSIYLGSSNTNQKKIYKMRLNKSEVGELNINVNFKNGIIHKYDLGYDISNKKSKEEEKFKPSSNQRFKNLELTFLDCPSYENLGDVGIHDRSDDLDNSQKTTEKRNYQLQFSAELIGYDLNPETKKRRIKVYISSYVLDIECDLTTKKPLVYKCEDTLILDSLVMYKSLKKIIVLNVSFPEVRFTGTYGPKSSFSQLFPYSNNNTQGNCLIQSMPFEQISDSNKGFPRAPIVDPPLRRYGPGAGSF